MDAQDEHVGLFRQDDIIEVVEKLSSYLGTNSGSFKNTLKELDILRVNFRFFHPDNLQKIKPHREEMAAAWLRQLKRATHDAKALIDDIESEVKASDPSISDIDNRNMIKIIYTSGRLADLWAEAEFIFYGPNLNENASKDEKKGTLASSSVAMRRETKCLIDDDFLVGRDEEISIIKDMVLDNAHYVPVAASLEGREEVDKLLISQKGWIIQTFKNSDLSKKTQEAAESAPSNKIMCNKVEYLRRESNLRNPIVIPIVGISGVGKSALAQFIFNDRSVREHFGRQAAWVYMTDGISLEEITKQIIFSFGPEQAHANDMINLRDDHTLLKSIIEGKRFFLVLDSVWNEIHGIWGDLRTVLNRGAPGSIVLVTTQLYSVASSLGTTGPIVLDPLQCDESWTLFKRYAFSDPCDIQTIEALEPIGRKIAERLHGLPLVERVVGASLRTTLEEDHWGKLLKSCSWNDSDYLEFNSIISSLESCYFELPGYLKQCFIYCSIFPRYYVFEKYKLVQMWITIGFVQVDDSIGLRNLEDIADGWFDELVNRIFLQPSACKTGYVMHDLVRDFACALASNEYHGTFDNELKDFSQIQHLSTEIGNLRLSVQQGNCYRKLRTLMLSGDSRGFFSGEACRYIDKILKNSKSLRILDFSSSRWSGAASRVFDRCAFKNYELYSQCWLRIGHKTSPQDAGREFSPPRVISELKYLKHLDLSYTGINTLPDSICGLCDLQVLDLRGCIFQVLPKGINELISLRHLHASSRTIAQIYGIGKLTKLQKLNDFCVKAEDGHRIAELRNLNDIRGSLCISNLEMVNDPREVLQCNLAGKHYLTDLELKWSNNLKLGDESDNSRTLYLTAEKLGGLSLPRNLQDFKIFGYPGNIFPDWIGQLKYVRVIEISSCEKLQSLPPLGQLEHLRKLKFHNLSLMKDISSILCGTSDAPFQSLEELSFEQMWSWESWTYAGHGEFIPNLQKLQIVRCSELRQVPFESLGSATKELLLLRCGRNAHMVSRYLPRLTSLTRLEIHCSWGEPDHELILPCEQLRSLEYLEMKYFRRVRIKGGLWYIKSLKDLIIYSCDTITTELGEVSPHEQKHGTSRSARDMHSLTHLTVSLRNDLNSIVPRTPVLHTLHISHCSSTAINSDREQWLRQLTSVQSLEISELCYVLPSSLYTLSSLTKLNLKDCQFHMIPPHRLPRNLKELQIEKCSIELEARCQKRNGEVWPTEEKMMEWRRGKIQIWRSEKVEYWGMKLRKVIWSDETQIWLRKKREEGCWSLEDLVKSAEKELLQSRKDSSRQQSSESESRGKGKDGDKQFRERTREEDFSSIAELLESAEERWLLRPLLSAAHSMRFQRPTDENDTLVRVRLSEALAKMGEEKEHLNKEREEWLTKEEEDLFELKGKDWPHIAHIPYIRVNGEIVQNLYT